MRLLLVADTYPPGRISGALQMRDLALELARQGHRPVVLTPVNGPGAQWNLEEVEGVQVLRVRAPRTKDVWLIKRAIAEWLLPWMLLRGLRASPLRDERWDGIVWYSPTIFLGPLVRKLKLRHGCRAYLIVRDLFPDWAVDAGVMRKGMVYRYFKAVERYQYRQADVIGVQTPSNVPLVARDAPDGARIEVLHNWLSPPILGQQGGDVVGLRHLKGRILYVYAGNMGVAQDVNAFVDLAERLRERRDVGFVFVGRGSELTKLRDRAKTLGNVIILDEIEPTALSELLRQCHVGIIALHPAHATHNIPGKLLTYLHAGLPVLARVNPDNDLVELVEREAVGLAVCGDDLELLCAHACRLADDPAMRRRMGDAGKDLASCMFAPSVIAKQVASAVER
jgi:glycosyltransferase involved in cell wall biosynthesis